MPRPGGVEDLLRVLRARKLTQMVHTHSGQLAGVCELPPPAPGAWVVPTPLATAPSPSPGLWYACSFCEHGWGATVHYNYVLTQPYVVICGRCLRENDACVS
jgi:hypothetical protein